GLLATGVGDLVDALAVALDRAHQALVLQELEGGVDGPGAGAPCAAGLGLEGLDDLVAVARALAEDRQQGGADVAPAHAAAAVQVLVGDVVDVSSPRTPAASHVVH